jgi:drug/metabolite transporter (DMT)-like permease
MNWSRASYALAAAFLFGISTPASKFLLEGSTPILMAGFLYFGSGIGLGGWLAVRRLIWKHRIEFHEISARDWIYLAGATLIGGVASPILLMMGLARTSASASALLLNFEAPFTALIACLIFGERYGRRLVFGMALIVLGGIILSQSRQSDFHGNLVGVLCVAGASLGWAIDTNLTRHVLSMSAELLAATRGLAAGLISLAIASGLGQRPAGIREVTATAVLGFFSYGVSMLCYIHSMRRLGAARSAAYFSTATFLGAIISLAVFREPVTWPLVVAGVVMAWGIGLHLTEK